MTAKNSRFGKLAGRIVLSSVEAVLIVSFLLVVGYAGLGYLEWRQVRTNMLAHGEKLTLAELAPPPIPDAHNFFADRMWRELSQVPPLPQGQRQLDGLRSKPDSTELQALKTKYPDLLWSSDRPERLSIAQAVWHYYVPKYVLNQQDAARFSLDILAPTDPLLQKINQLLDRAGSRMLPDYSDPAFVKDTTHFSRLFTVAQILTLRAKANLLLGNHDAAFADVCSLARLAEVGKREPLFWPFFLRESIAQICTGSIQQGLETHAWTDHDLQVFESLLAPIDLLAQFPLALRGERASFNAVAENCLSRMPTEYPYDDAWSKFSYRVVARFLSLTILPADQALYSRMMQPAIDAADQAPVRGLGQSKITDPSFDVFTKRLGEYRYPFTQALFPLVADQACHVARVQDAIIQARLACALERYRLKNGTYPSELAALVPTYLPSMPVDVVTLQPMHYQLDKSGNFRLWSVGWNETDDGGIQSGYTSQKKGDWIWGQRRSQGA